MRDNLILKAIGRNLYDALTFKDISFSDAINRLGFSDVFFHSILDGQHSLSIEDCYYICRTLNISMDFLFGFSDIVSPVCQRSSEILDLDFKYKEMAEGYIRYLHELQETELRSGRANLA